MAIESTLFWELSYFLPRDTEFWIETSGREVRLAKTPLIDVSIAEGDDVFGETTSLVPRLRTDSYMPMNKDDK
jgi:hypothetical protein